MNDQQITVGHLRTVLVTASIVSGMSRWPERDICYKAQIAANHTRVAQNVIETRGGMKYIISHDFEVLPEDRIIMRLTPRGDFDPFPEGLD